MMRGRGIASEKPEVKSNHKCDSRAAYGYGGSQGNCLHIDHAIHFLQQAGKREKEGMGVVQMVA